MNKISVIGAGGHSRSSLNLVQSYFGDYEIEVFDNNYNIIVDIDVYIDMLNVFYGKDFRNNKVFFKMIELDTNMSELQIISSFLSPDAELFRLAEVIPIFGGRR